MRRVHPTAVVDPGAKLGDDVCIGPYSVVGEGVELDEGVEIGSHVVLTGPTRVGARSRIFPFCVIGGEPQVRDAEGRSWLRIGRENVIREYTSIHCGTPSPGGGTTIGDGNFLLNNVHVAHDCRLGSHCVLTSFAALAGHVEVLDHAVLGARVGVHQFCRVGESSFIGAGSRLSKDAPPFARVLGARARFAGVNTLGLERRGFSAERIADIKHAYHLLFQSKLRLEPALARVEAECGDVPEVARLLAFFRGSARGVTRS
ncbi:MAG: acyl-ACP--UDP-N-acetylglucosamine O-acyltransferase [Deltaproteobacteria bacterium]|nr:acyl-ACP--UDP-N-acetylglucosamine O-acyltransferase [Deltaproteobacteria bacterium]MBW2361497.1 acyl-ACP--UDP-N-acetylglucosamine O-acyltransferase [Deltaproteobacteria bacterium]